MVTAQKETRSRERRQKSKVTFMGNENAVGSIAGDGSDGRWCLHAQWQLLKSVWGMLENFKASVLGSQNGAGAASFQRRVRTPWQGCVFWNRLAS